MLDLVAGDAMQSKLNDADLGQIEAATGGRYVSPYSTAKG